jgi:mannose-1-phosphate guanylyltransferase
MPETGYGYIEMADLEDVVDGQEVYRVRRFVEKPDRETAEKYCQAGNYLWNSGMFAWSIPTIMSLCEKHLPDTYARLMRIREAIGRPDEITVLDLEYKEMQQISVDYGIMEKLDDILVLPGDFGWNDIGSWATVAEIAQKDEDGNIVSRPHICLDTRNCMIISTDSRIVATIGIEDLIVVDTEDALLICRKDRAQDVKKVVDKLKEENLDGYL